MRLGRTEAEIAAAAGVSTVTLYRFERSGAITLDRLLALAAVLGMSVELNAVTVGGRAKSTRESRAPPRRTTPEAITRARGIAADECHGANAIAGGVAAAVDRSEHRGRACAARG